MNRTLLTYHDSFPYFAREYGWTVIGAIQPSDFAEPTAQDVANLIDQVLNTEPLPLVVEEPVTEMQLAAALEVPVERVAKALADQLGMRLEVALPRSNWVEVRLSAPKTVGISHGSPRKTGRRGVFDQRGFRRFGRR